MLLESDSYWIIDDCTRAEMSVACWSFSYRITLTDPRVQSCVLFDITTYTTDSSEEKVLRKKKKTLPTCTTKSSSGTSSSRGEEKKSKLMTVYKYPVREGKNKKKFPSDC